MSKNKKRNLSRVMVSSALALPLLSSVACGNSTVRDDIATGTGSTDPEMSAALKGLKEIEMAPVTPGLTQIDCQGKDCPQDGLTEDGQYDCTYKRWSKVEVFDSYAVFQPDLDRLYPGAMFRGRAYVEKGYLDEIVLAPEQRKGVEASFSLENTTQSPTITMDPPTLASYREERNRVLSGQMGTNPTTVQLSMQQVFSESHFSSAAGAVVGFGAGTPGAGVAAMFGAAFDRQKQTKSNMFMLRMRQQNYQVNLAPAASPADYFYPDPDAQSVIGSIEDDTMPLVVSDLFYGRLVLCAVSSRASEEETRHAWMVAIAGGLIAQGVGVGGGVAGALTDAQKLILSESQVDCFVNGGAGSDAVKTVQGVDGIVAAILGSGDQSAKTPGGLIGYRLTTLTNKELPISTTSSYTSQECLKTTGDLTMTLDRLKLHGTGADQTGNDQEVYGKIGITYPEPGSTLTDCTPDGGVGGKTVLLFDKGRDDSVQVLNNFVREFGESRSGQVNARAAAKVCVFGKLFDKDNKFLGLIQLDHDDELGRGAELVDVKKWNGSFTLKTDHVDVDFTFDLSP